MSEKMFNTRIQHKHDVEANWLKAVNFVPKAGELIVYDPDENFSYARTKMGDGLTGVNDLPFVQVQSDWNQSSENAADYVKNRTHYEEVIEESIEGLTYNISSSSSITHNLHIPFKLGQIWGLVIYSYGEDTTEEDTPTNYEVLITDDGILYIGDMNNNGEPSPLYITTDTLEIHASYSHMINYSGCKIVGVSGTYTIDTIIHKLDPKYLPDTIYYTDEEILQFLSDTINLSPVTENDAFLVEGEDYLVL